MSEIQVPVSPGEVLDKITILRIKAKRMTDAAKLGNSGPGGLQAAAPIFQRILKLDPKNVNALNSLGVICINANLLRRRKIISP